MIGAILLAMGILPAPDPYTVESCAVIEVHHFYDDQGKHVFDQLLFRDWSPAHGEFPIIAWRLMKKSSMRPVRDWRTGEWVSTFADGMLIREVRAKALQESWMQADIEQAEREDLPQEMRRGLLYQGNAPLPEWAP